MSDNGPTDILAGSRSTTGNGNFDVAAIAIAATRLVDSQPSEAEQEIHALFAQAQQMFDELLANPSSGLVEEATQFLNAFQGFLPPGLAAQARAAITLQEERIAASPDRGGPTGDAWREQRERDDKDRKDQAKIADMADDLNNSQQRLTEQQWDEGTYDFAGEPMTGAQIDSLMAFMRNPANRERLIEQRAKAKGITTEQAARDVDLGLRYAELFRKNEMGTATAEEQAELARLRNNPTANEVVSDARRLESEAGPTAPAAEIGMSQNQGQTISVAARIDRLDNPNASTAPTLRDHHRAALAATAPLDVPAEPVRIAAIAPAPEQVAATGMNF